MPDSKSKRGAPDRKRISLKQAYERAYWRKRFKCNQFQLSEAVLTCGHSVRKVAAYFNVNYQA